MAFKSHRDGCAAGKMRLLCRGEPRHDRRMNRHFGRATLCGLAMLAVGAGACASAAEEGLRVPPKLPARDFVRMPDVSAAQLSPDGKFLAYVYDHEAKAEIAFLDIEKNRARYFNPGYGSLVDFVWASNERAIVAGAGLGSLKRNTDGWVGLTGYFRYLALKGARDLLYAEEVIHADGRDPERVLILDRNTSFGEPRLYPDVIEMDADTGMYRQRLKNPGHVIQWLADWDGQLRFGVKWENRTARIICRDDEKSAWRPLGEPGAEGEERLLLGMDATGRVLHLGQPNAAGFWAIYPFDITRAVAGESIFEHERYDIVPREFAPSYAGVSLAAPIYSRKSRELLGVRYVTDVPRQYWFDPVLAGLQEQLDRAFPGLVNQIVSFSYDETRMLVLSWSDREPGIYTLIDLAAEKKLKPIGRSRPWIKPEQMAPTLPFELRARDGLLLHGYCTLPAGRGQENLPAVMLVHGGPWVRDAWGFDPVVQFLANRGYAVLQVNYRGSSGYGVDFARKGRAEIGGAIQDDITDTVRWAIKQGIVDPQRVAIMGGSYGGYSALFAAGKTPELYRCAVSLAGVTDWPALIKRRDDREHQITYAYWEKRIGQLDDPAVMQRLAAVSPINFAGEIRLPLLLAHGKEDEIVPVDQTKQLAVLLKKLGREPEVMYFDRTGHSFPMHERGEKFFNQLEAFLAKHLGPP